MRAAMSSRRGGGRALLPAPAHSLRPARLPRAIGSRRAGGHAGGGSAGDPELPPDPLPRYHPVVIPPFDPETGNLPPGVHEATWGELVARYGYNAHRRKLLVRLKAALDALHVAGCRRVYIDGSFVTNKAEPADFDACWEWPGVAPGLLDPILLAFDLGRAEGYGPSES